MWMIREYVDKLIEELIVKVIILISTRGGWGFV